MSDLKEPTQALVEKSTDEAIQSEVVTPVEMMLNGNESAYQQCLSLALSATKSRDWIDMGGTPYLAMSGADKVAFRFGLSIKIDRDNNGRPIFDREDFTDEMGQAAIYTVSGTGQLGTRVVEAIGSSSTRDDFLGWIGKKNDPERKPKPFYEVVEDAKKKAVTNLKNNIIQSFIGLKGLSWEDLAEFGVSRDGKAAVNYKKKPGAKTTKRMESKKDDRPPCWQWEGDDGNKLISAKAGDHFTEEFLLGIGLKKGGKGIFTSRYSETKWETLQSQLNDAPQEEPKKEELPF